MPLSAAIEQTAELANNDAQVLDDRAPALASGTSVATVHVRRAEREHKRRKLMNENNSLATVEEVSASHMRLAALETAVVMDTYGAALHGAAPVTQAALDEQTQTLTVTLTKTMTAMMSAMMSAESCRRYNATVLRYAEPANLTTEFRRLPKVKAGRKDGGNITVAGVPAEAEDVGTVCPNVLFPRDEAALRVLTPAAIEHLSIWYNDGFGIVEADEEQARRDKFRSYIQW